MIYDGPRISLPDDPRILITRLSAIGDCIHTVPVANALRERYPYAFIAWVTQAGGASLIQSLRSIDDLIVVPRGWMKSARQIVDVRRQLQERQFDISIDPQSLTKSALLGWLSGAKFRIGFDRPAGRELSSLLNNFLIPPTHQHVIERYLDLLAPIDIAEPNVVFDLQTKNHESITSFLRQHRLMDDFVLVNPGAGWPSKIWPANRFARVVRGISTHCSVRSVVVWAGPEERKMAQQIVAESNGDAVLAGRTSLPELQDLASRCRLFVGSDTGPLHLAAAVGTPCVAIHGPTSPLRCGPYGRNHRVIYKPVDDNQKLRSDDNRAMLAVTSEEVLRECCRLLGTERRLVA